jgi:hypothetical protein
MELLVSHSFFPILNLALHLLVSIPYVKPQVVSKLIQHGASVSSNVDGRTPLWVYCILDTSSKNLEVFHVLAQAGSNLNQAVRATNVCTVK